MENKKENYPEPEWLKQGIIFGNNRLITYLSIMWKTLRAEISEEIYYSLQMRNKKHVVKELNAQITYYVETNILTE